MVKQLKQKEQEESYAYFLNCSTSDLEKFYDSYLYGYPSYVAPMIRAFAEAKGFDTSKWKDFYR